MTDGGPAAGDGWVRLGVVSTTPATADLARRLAAELPGRLEQTYGEACWDVSEHHADLGGTGDPQATVERARELLVAQDWDLVVVLLDGPLSIRRRPVLARASTTHGVGLVSVPALGAGQVSRRLADVVQSVVRALLGAGDRDDLVGRIRELRDDGGIEGSGAQDGTVLLTARVLRGNVRLLLGMVRANRPWRFTLRLSRALSAAAGAGVLALITPDVWVLADAYGPVRLSLLGVASVAATALTLLLGAGLWERARDRRRRQVVLFNLATLLTVLIGVTALHVALLVLASVGAVALVVPGVLAETVGHPVGAWELLRLAWFTATLSTLAGALGAGLEDDLTVREAAYHPGDEDDGAGAVSPSPSG